MGRHTVVIPKKRRPRKVLKQKIMVMWRNVTIPCSYSDWLTPAILLNDIDSSLWVTPGSLIKAILTPQNQPMGTLNFEIPLSLQGAGQGDTLIMLVRHAKVHDPHDVQHLVAYRAEDVIQHFLTALLETSSHTTLLKGPHENTAQPPAACYPFRFCITRHEVVVLYRHFWLFRAFFFLHVFVSTNGFSKNGFVF